jgi:PAS domain-containing protein
VDRNAKQLAETVVQEVDGREMQARRGLNAAGGGAYTDFEIQTGTLSGIGEGLAPSQRGAAVEDRKRRFSEASEDRRRARVELERAREGQRRFEGERSAGIRQFEQDISAGALGDDAKQLIVQRDEARAKLDAGGLDPFAIKQEEEKLAAAIAGLASIFATSPIAATLELLSNQLDARAQQAVEVTRQIEAERESVSRGEQLSKTPGQSAQEDLEQRLQDIRNYFNQAAEESSGLPKDVAEIRGKMDEALARAEEDAMRQVAPAVFALQDARENALLQGPSRAALGASDVTTMQGQAELNRLLRGDDPAKDVNLLELEKQTKLLEELAKKENQVI